MGTSRLSIGEDVVGSMAMERGACNLRGGGARSARHACTVAAPPTATAEPPCIGGTAALRHPAWPHCKPSRDQLLMATRPWSRGPPFSRLLGLGRCVTPGMHRNANPDTGHEYRQGSLALGRKANREPTSRGPAATPQLQRDACYQLAGAALRRLRLALPTNPAARLHHLLGLVGGSSTVSTMWMTA
jgi:hypothetical protein